MNFPGVGSLNYTYDNSVWVLNDPTCMVAAYRIMYFGKSTNLIVIRFKKRISFRFNTKHGIRVNGYMTT